MKIGIHWVQFEAGGVDTHLLSMIKNWPNDDHFILFHNKNNEGLKRISAELGKYEVELVAFPSIKQHHMLIKLFRFVFFPIFFFWLERSQSSIVRSVGDLDAIIVQNGTYPGSWHSLAAVWAAHKLHIKKRMLIIHHGALHSNIIHHPGEKLIDYMIHKWATDLVAVSRATRQTLIDYRGFDPSRNPIRVVHNGIDPSTDFAGNTAQIRKQLNIGDNVTLLGMVGRIERYKGHEDLLLAMSEMDTKMIDRLAVIFIGSGEVGEIDRLNKMAKTLGLEEKIIIPGYIDGDSIQLISQLNILLMLTKDFEGFGLTIAEAMISDVPVIATKVGAVQEFVNQEVAHLIPPESPSDIARVLTAYLNNPDEFKLRAKKAKKHIERFSGAKMSNQYCRLLHI